MLLAQWLLERAPCPGSCTEPGRTGPCLFATRESGTPLAAAIGHLTNRCGAADPRDAGAPEFGSAARAMLDPVPYTIVAMDVAGSGSLDDILQLRMRADLRSLTAGALARQGLEPSGLSVTDLGDGLRLVVPPAISPIVLLDPFIPNLVAALRRHRRAASDASRLRLRVAVHLGLLHRDALGWAGAALVTCARMLDARPLRQVLARDDSVDLVLAVSQAVFDGVVQPGYGLDPATFRRVDISEKETTAPVWLHVPGHRRPPGLPDSTGDRSAAAAAAESAGRAPALPATAPEPTGAAPGWAGQKRWPVHDSRPGWSPSATCSMPYNRPRVNGAEQ